MKTQIIEDLDLLLKTTSEYNTFHIALITKIKQDLINEWTASDNYAAEIRAVLDMDNTYELLHNIKIR